MESAADIMDTSIGTSDAALPEVTETAVESERRMQTLTAVVHDFLTSTAVNDRIAEALSSTLLLGKLVRTSTVSDPAVAKVVVSTVATTLTAKDASTIESNIPTVHFKQDVHTVGISAGFGSDAVTTTTPITEVETANRYDDIHSDFDDTTVSESVILSRNATTTEAEIADISTALPPNGENPPTAEVSSASTSNANVSLKSSISSALPSNHDTSTLTTEVPITLTSPAMLSLKSEYQTTPESDFMAGLTSGIEVQTSEVDSTEALQSTTMLTSEVDSTSDAFTLHSRLESSTQNGSSMMTQGLSNAIPVTTSTVADTTSVVADTTSAVADTTSVVADTTSAVANTTSAVADTTSAVADTTSAVADTTSIGTELGTTTLVSLSSSTGVPHAIDTSRTTNPVELSSEQSTSSAKSSHLSTRLSTKDTSSTVIPTRSRTSAFLTTSAIRSLPTSLAVQKSTTSHVSSSLSYTFSTQISGQHDLSSLAATTDRMKNYQTDVFQFNGTLNGTAIVDAYPSMNVALAISLSLVFGLTFILVVSALVYCLLRSYCHRFRHCCSKHTGHCKLCSYSCVENRHYHGLQQRLTETPDLISESVHAQITRIARGSSHPDQIALLERSLDDQHSLNELDQLVFEDPDLVYPTSELFVDCRLVSASSSYDCCSPESEHVHESSDDQSGQSSTAAGGRAQRNSEGACFRFPDSGACAHGREPRAGSSNRGRWRTAMVENPYLRPSCHAHVEPGPNWRPFHPYDPVYVPHHDPIGMQRRLEGTYVTSPRLRRNLYEEVRVNADTQRLMPASPPIVPSRGTGTDSINAPVAPIRVSSRPSPVVPNRGVGGGHGNGTPVAPVRVSSRTSPIVHSRGTVTDRNASAGTPKPPARVSSRSSPGPARHRGAATMDHTRPSSPVTPLRTRSRSPPPTTPSRPFLLSSINSPTKGSSRAAGESSLLDRSLPKLPVSENSPEPSVACYSGGQRDSTSSSATIPGHEYSRVDFGRAQQGPALIVTTAEVEPYETDSDSCRDGAYESIDFPKNPPPS